MNLAEFQSHVLSLFAGSPSSPLWPGLAPGEINWRANSSPPVLQVPERHFFSVMLRLRASPALSFDQLQAHTALDWPSEGEIECLYLLNSTQHPQDALVSVKLSRAAPVITSVSSLWPIAEWQEREVFDMFGVLYEHHPDLRRILLDDDWLGFPLRKDYKDDFMLSRPW